jgi:hypothetical protein
MLKIKTLILTLLIVLGFSGLGVIFWKYHTQSIYTLIGIIVLLFMRHIYVTVDYYTNDK